MRASIAVSFLLATSALGQINLTSTSYSTNFNGLGTNATATLPDGWRMSAAGASSPTFYAAGNFTGVNNQASSGTPTTGGRYNWGATGGTDRAIGFMTSGGYASPNSIMFGFTNNAGGSITQAVAGFSYELYRRNSAAATNTFSYSTDGTNWTVVAAGGSPNWPTGTSVYGFPIVTSTVTRSGVTVSNLNVATGARLFFRWNFNTTGGNSQGLGLDDFSLSLNIAAATPTLNAVTLASALTGTYGTSSAGTSFIASGSDLSGNITVTAQTGFEVSTSSGSGYGNSVSVASGTTVWVRTAATRGAGAFNNATVAVLSGGGAASSANVTSSSSGNSVAQLAITGTFTASNKEYDGNNSASVATRAVTGRVGSDDVNHTGGTATFNNANAGNGKTVTLAGASLTGAASANYTLSSVSTTTANITQKALTGTFTASNKEYDGNNSASVATRAVTGRVGSDDVNHTGGTATFDNANAGNGKTVTLAEASLTGSAAANYTLSSVSTTTANITQKALTGTFTASNKEYDGNNSASVATRAVTGRVGSDDVNHTGGTATFDNANTGNGKTVTLAGASLTGAASANYTLSSVSTTTANISPKALTITANDVNKQVGQSLTGGAGSTAFTSSGLVGLETVGSVTIAYGSGAAAGDPEGTYAGQVTPSAATGGTFNASNYSITYVAGVIIVSSAPLPVISTNGSPSAMSTTYGTASSPTSFGVSGANMTAGITATAPAGYEVSLSSGSGFATSVVVSGSGTIGSNTIFVRLATNAPAGTINGFVELSSAGASPLNVALPPSTVNQKTVTITGIAANNKIYDRTTNATLSGTAAYDGLMNGESFSVSGTPSANFTTATVGDGKAVTVTGYLPPSANYALTQPTLTANITRATLTVTNAVAANKVYDRITAATISGATLSGVFSGDTVTLGNNSTGMFANATVGNGKSVTTFMIISGADAGNYTLTQPTLTANITAKELTVTGAIVTAKTYDGNTSATISGATLSGVVSPDVVTLGNSSTGTFVTASAGTKSVTTFMTISGADVTNYFLTQPAISGTINQKALTVTANNVTKDFGVTLTGGSGSTAFTSSGLVSGETIGSVTITYGAAGGASADAGIYANQVTPSAATGGSFAAGNYTITYVSGSITVNAIAPEVTTTMASATNDTTATSGGNVTSSGGVTVTNRGVVWALSPSTPTVPGAQTTNGAGSGSFASTLTNLVPGATYNYRAFAQNSVGTSYGAQQTLTARCFGGVVTGLSVTATNQFAFTASWSNFAGATGYQMDVSDSSTFSTLLPGPYGSEAFTNVGGGTSSSYLNRQWTNNGVAWTGLQARIDQTINGTAALTLENAAGSFLVSQPITGGVSALSFTHQRKFGSAGQTGGVDVFVNGVRVATNVPYSDNVVTTSISGLNISGSFVVMITNATTTHRVALDDIMWTNVISSGVFVSGYSNRAVAATSVSVTGLADNATYYWRVRATNENCVTGNSATNTITTLPCFTGAIGGLFASATNDTSFTAAWTALPGADGYLLDVASSTNFSASRAATVAFQGFEGAANDSWSIASTDGYVTNRTGSGDTPANSRIRTGSFSWQVDTNVTISTLTLADTLIQGFTSVTATVRISATDTAGGGLELSDTLKVFVALNGSEFPTSPSVLVRGFTGGARWGYAASGVAVNTAGNPTVTNQPSGSGTRTADGFSTIRITIPDGSTSVAIRVEAESDFTSELWNVDDIELAGIANDFVPGYNNRAVAANSQSVTGLTEGLTYFFRVRATNSLGCLSSFSATQSVTTVDVTPPAVSNFLVAGGSIITDAQLTNGAIISATIFDRGGISNGVATPTFLIRNNDGTIVASNRFASVPANRSTGGELSGTFTGAFNNVTLGTYTATVYALDVTGNNRSTNFAFAVTDDDVAGPDATAMVGTNALLIDESFESTNFPPAGWSQNSITRQTTDARTGTGHIMLNGTNDWIMTPLLTMPSYISFWYKRTSNTDAWSMQVEYAGSTNGPWTSMGSITGASTMYQVFSNRLDTLTNVYIRLRDTRPSGIAERRIDDITVADRSVQVFTDSQMTSGGYSISMTAQDAGSGLAVSNAVAPRYAIYNANNQIILSNFFATAFASGNTNQQSLAATAPAVAGNLVTLGTNTAFFFAADADADRVNDALDTAFGPVAMVVNDDDTNAPVIGVFGAGSLPADLTLGSLTITGRLEDASGIDFSRTYYLLRDTSGAVVFSNAFASVSGTNVAVSHTISPITGLTCGQTYTVTVFAADNDLDRGVADSLAATGGVFVITTIGQGTPGDAPVATNLTINGTPASAAATITDAQLAGGTWSLGIGLSHPIGIFTNAGSPSIRVTNSAGAAIASTRLNFTGTNLTTTFFTNTPMPAVSYANVFTGLHAVLWSATNIGACVSGVSDRNLISGGTNIFSVVDDDTTGPSLSGFAIAGGVYTVDVNTALSSGIAITGLVQDASGIAIASAPAYALIYRANGSVIASNQASGADNATVTPQGVSITLTNITDFACGNSYTVRVFAADNDNDRANDRLVSTNTIVIFGSGTGGETPIARNLLVNGAAAGSAILTDDSLRAGSWTLGLTISLGSANLITNGVLAPTFNITGPGGAFYGSEQTWTGITRSGTNYTLTATIAARDYAAVTTGTHTVRWSARGEGLCFGAAAQSETIIGGATFTVSDDDAQAPVILSFNAAGGVIDDCVNANPCRDITRTNLVAGDIAIFAMNTISAFGGGQDKDEFAFVPLVDLPAGTEIKFTDNGWRSDVNAFRSQEGVLTWRATSCVTAGTVIRWVATNTTKFTVGTLASSEGTFALNTAAEQILAYQGPNNSPNFIYALHQPTVAGTWDAPPGANSSRTSARPPGLVDGLTAVIVPDFDNVIINTNTLAVSGTRDQVLSYIGNRANWVGASADFYNIASFSFTFPGLCFTGGTITDQDVRNGGWTIQGLVEDTGSGISTSGLSYEIINTAGGVISSNLLAASYTNGARTVAFTNTISAAASTNLITVGSYTSRIVAVDVDNDRMSDSAAASTNVAFNVTDDDSDPPQLRNFSFNGKTVISNEAELASIVISGEVRDIESGIAFASATPSYEVISSSGQIVTSGSFTHGNRPDGAATNWVSITSPSLNLSSLNVCGVYTVRVTVADADADRANDRLVTALPIEFAFAPGSSETPVASGLTVNGLPVAGADITDHGLTSLTVALTISHPFGLVSDEDVFPSMKISGPTGTVFSGGTVSSVNATTVTITASWNVDYDNRDVGAYTVTWSARSPGICFGGAVNSTNITGGHVFTIRDDDIEPPAVVTNLASTAEFWSNNPDVTFTWSAVTDASGIHAYRLVSGAAPTGVDDGTSIGVTNRAVVTNTMEGVFTNWIVAVDNDNDRVNDRLAGTATSVVIKLDWTPPASVAAVTAANDPSDVSDTSSEVMLNWAVTANTEAEAAGPRYDGEPLSPFTSYRIYYTENDAGAQWPTSNDPYFDVLDGFADLSDFSTTNLLLTGLNPGTDYRFAIAAVDEAGNRGPLSNTEMMIRTEMFDVTNAFVGANNGVVIEWSGNKNAPYDIIYAEGVGYDEAAMNGWMLATTVNSNRFIDAGEFTLTAPINLHPSTQRFYRVAPRDAWIASDTRRGVASSNVVTVKKYALRQGNNIVGLGVEPFDPSMRGTFGVDRLPSFSVFGSYATNSDIQIYRTSANFSPTEARFNLIAGHPRQWTYTTNNEDYVAADHMLAPLFTNALMIKVPVATNFILVGKVRGFMTNEFQQAMSTGQITTVNLSFPFPVAVKDIPGLTNAQAYFNIARADRIITLTTNNPPRAKEILYRTSSGGFVYAMGGSGLADNHKLKPSEPFIYQTFARSAALMPRTPPIIDFTPSETVLAKLPPMTTQITNPLPSRPSVNRLITLQVSPGQVTVQSRVNPNRRETRYWFHVGTNSAQENIVELGSLEATSRFFSVETTITAVDNLRYFVELVASNTLGVVTGDTTFILGCPAIAITNTSLAGLPAGNATYAQQLGAIGGAGDYSYELISGSLPSGLRLTTDGLITGVGSGVGRTFSIRVTDRQGCSGVWQGQIQRTEISVSANPASVCSGESTMLSLIGHGGGGSHQWQKSMDGINYANIAGAVNVDYTAANISTATYFRAIVTSAENTITSSIAVITVNSCGLLAASESFAFVGTGAINGLGTSGGGWSASWSSSIGNWQLWSNSLVGPSGYPASTGSSAMLGSLAPGVTGTISRPLSNVASNGIIYVAALVKYNVTGTLSRAGITLLNGTNSVAYAGKAFGVASKFGAEAGTSNQTASVDMNASEVNLVILRFDFAAASLRAQLYPSTSSVGAEPSTWHVHIHSALVSSVDRVGLTGTSSANIYFDELRIAPSWSALFTSP